MMCNLDVVRAKSGIQREKFLREKSTKKILHEEWRLSEGVMCDWKGKLKVSISGRQVELALKKMKKEGIKSERGGTFPLGISGLRLPLKLLKCDLEFFVCRDCEDELAGL